MRWEEAEEFCRGQEAHLASVTSSEIHEYLVAKLQPSHNNEILAIGATDQDLEGRWVWTDCSPWNYTRWGVGPKGQQPDNNLENGGQNGEDCVQIVKQFQAEWFDAPCGNGGGERKVVCSRKICQGNLY